MKPSRQKAIALRLALKAVPSMKPSSYKWRGPGPSEIMNEIRKHSVKKHSVSCPGKKDGLPDVSGKYIASDCRGTFYILHFWRKNGKPTKTSRAWADLNITHWYTPKIK